MDVRPILVVLLGTTLAACGEKKMLIDAEAVDEALDFIDAEVPLCAATSSDGTMARLPWAAGRLDALTRAARALSRADLALGLDVMPVAGIGASGSCGGTLDVLFEHESGDTDYTVTMSEFCISSADGELVFDGVVIGREDGNPSDSGPVVDTFELRTDGDVDITHADGTIAVNLEGARTEYGLPEPWAPGTPDASNPDVTTVDSLTGTFDGDERFVRDVTFERTGGVQAEVTILEGKLGTAGEGYVDLQTVDGEPLQVDLLGGRLTGGALRLTGKKGSEVVVRPSGDGRFEIALDGADVGRQVDCTAMQGAKSEVVSALIAALPIF